MSDFRFTGMPVDAQVIGGFGEWYFFDDRPPYQHRGVDLGAFYLPVINMANRTQLVGRLFNPDGSFGTAVVLIDEETGLHHLYAHLSEAHVRPGDRVEPGEQIGISGATGYVKGAHLHWQLDWTGSWSIRLQDNLDPIAYIKEEPMGMTPDEKKAFDALAGDLTKTKEDLARANRIIAGWGVPVVITETEAAEMRRRRYDTVASKDEEDVQTLTGQEALDLLDIRNGSLYGGLMGLNTAVLDTQEKIIAAAADFDQDLEGAPRDASLATSLGKFLPMRQ